MDPASFELAVLANAWDQHTELVRTMQRDLATKCEEAVAEDRARRGPHQGPVTPTSPASFKSLNWGDAEVDEDVQMGGVDDGRRSGLTSARTSRATSPAGSRRGSSPEILDPRLRRRSKH